MAAQSFGRLALDDNGVPLLLERQDGESCRKLYATAIDKLPDIGAELAARRQLVGVATAINSREVDAAGRPHKRAASLISRELSEFE